MESKLPKIMFGAVVAVVTAAAQPAYSQAIEVLGEFRDWAAYRLVENGNDTCYMASQPKTEKGDYKKRGDIYAMVTHRPAEDRRDEVSIIAGYDYQKDSAVDVKIGKTNFELFTQGGRAWAPDSQADQKIVKAMIKGRTMVVKGVSTRGTETADTYSLSGFTKAYQTITKACKL